MVARFAGKRGVRTGGRWGKNRHYESGKLKSEEESAGRKQKLRKLKTEIRRGERRAKAETTKAESGKLEAKRGQLGKSRNYKS